MNTNTEKYQEVFNSLAELEEFFLYKRRNPGELTGYEGILAQMHGEVNTLLLQWHNLTGCKNQ